MKMQKITWYNSIKIQKICNINDIIIKIIKGVYKLARPALNKNEKKKKISITLTQEVLKYLEKYSNKSLYIEKLIRKEIKKEYDDI